MEFEGRVVQPISESTCLTADGRGLCSFKTWVLKTFRVGDCTASMERLWPVNSNGSTAVQGHVLRGASH